MSIHWSYIVVTVVMLGIGLFIGYRIGRYMGTQALIRSLFEAKDQELWLAGHYVSVDIKEQTKPHTRRTARPRNEQ